MGKKVWNFELDGKHTVEVDESQLSGKRTIRVDGDIVLQDRAFDMGKDLPFKVGKHSCSVRSAAFLRNYDLVVDGRSMKSGKPTSPSVPLPKWAWAFVAACGAIPIVSLGGAIPAGIGGGGAVACAIIAKDSSKTKRKRVAMCLGVTVICWVLFAMLIFGIAFFVRGR